MNSCLVGLLGELKALARLEGSSGDLHLKYVSNFPIKNNDTYYQVDAIVICKKGIFCLEVKNWSCIVQCTSSYYWDVKYPTKSLVIRSPLAQNVAHCTQVEKILQRNCYNYVLFAGSTTLLNEPANVMHAPAFIPSIRKLPDILEAGDIDTLAGKLKAYKKKIEPDMLVDFLFKQVR